MFHSDGWGRYPVGRGGRWLLSGWCLFLIGGFTLASRLEPDQKGYGTHQRLGLPPCSFRTLFGIPCPSCGMTTSFAHFTRGQFSQAFRANAGGALLAVVCAVQIPWCVWSVARGRLIGVSDPTRGMLGVLLAVGGVSLVSWLFQLWG